MKQKFRLTIEMSAIDHVHLKTICAKLGISMREFLLRAAFEKIGAVEDEWLAIRARKTLQNIKERKDKLLPWDECKKRL